MIPIFIQSYKGSKRLPRLKKRFKALKLSFKIIYGASPDDLQNKKFLNNNYNKFFFTTRAGRKMIPPEIGCAYGHLKIYKYIIDNKIPEAIIFEDDVYPSKNFKYVLKNYSFKNVDVLVFFSTSGYIKKNNNFDRIKTHNIISHFNSSCAYKINLSSCEKIIKCTHGKIIGLSDWPINFLENNIKSALLLPLQIMLADQQMSTASSLRNKLIKFKNIKNKLPKFFLKIFLVTYYFLCIPYLFRIYPNFNYYKEYFWEKNFLLIKSIFFKNIVEIQSITTNLKNYEKDLSKKEIRTSLRYLYKTNT